MKHFVLLRFIIGVNNIRKCYCTRGGFIMTKIDRYTAARIAEGINTWAGKEYRKQIITADKVLNISPIETYEPDGYLVYAYQWGDVTILAGVFRDGSVRIKHICW